MVGIEDTMQYKDYNRAIGEIRALLQNGILETNSLNSLETATPTSSSIDFIKFKLGPKAITAICKGARGKSKALSNMGKAPAALKLSSITRLAGANITHTLVGSKFRTCMSLGSSDILEFTPTLLFYDTRSFQSPGVFSRTHTIANVVLY